MPLPHRTEPPKEPLAPLARKLAGTRLAVVRGGPGGGGPLPLSSEPTQDWTMSPAVGLAFRAALGADRVFELRATLV